MVRVLFFSEDGGRRPGHRTDATQLLSSFGFEKIPRGQATRRHEEALLGHGLHPRLQLYLHKWWARPPL